MPRQYEESSATVAEVVADFLAARAAKWSESSQRFYASRLARFTKALGERQYNSLTYKDILDYLKAAGLDAKSCRELSDSTKRHNAVAIEQLHKWARKERHLKRIFSKLEKPSVGTRDRIPTEAETKALLKGASPEFVRIYQALRQCGARPGELCGAQIDNIETEDGERAIVLTKHKTMKKTKRPRVIALGAKLASLVKQAIGARTEGPIFLSPAGKAWQVANLSRTFSRQMKRAGLSGLVLYLARHEHATALCHTIGIQAAAAALGHANISTTQRYVKTNRAQLRQNQDVFDCGEPEANQEPPATLPPLEPPAEPERPDEEDPPAAALVPAA